MWSAKWETLHIHAQMQTERRREGQESIHGQLHADTSAYCYNPIRQGALASCRLSEVNSDRGWDDYTDSDAECKPNNWKNFFYEITVKIPTQFIIMAKKNMGRSSVICDMLHLQKWNKNAFSNYVPECKIGKNLEANTANNIQINWKNLCAKDDLKITIGCSWSLGPRSALQRLQPTSRRTVAVPSTVLGELKNKKEEVQ